jgi:uncharacterized protein (TIGR03435 family)
LGQPRPGPPPGTEPSAEDRAFADPARPTLQQVLDKVGLKLESTKGPVQILIVDHIERLRKIKCTPRGIRSSANYTLKLSLEQKLPLLAAGFIGIVNAPQLRAQNPTARPAFEVVSVKANKSGVPRPVQMQVLPGGTLMYKNLPLRVIVSQAYSLPFNSLEWITGPDWINTERFDIQAKAPPGVIPAGLPEKQRNDKSMLMLQSVLADRFRMATHWETKQGLVYSLTVSKNGLKLPKAKTAEEDCPEVSSRDGYCHMFVGGQGNGVHGKRVEISDLVAFLDNWTDHPVIDNIGLKGLFDIDTEGWVPMRPRPGPQPGTEPSAEDRAFADPARPTLQQLLDKVGLKSESTKGPFQILVIDHIERPSEN